MDHAEAVDQEPLITISGHYRESDGRVKKHKFPVEFKLSANGRVTGTYESWIEKRFSDGTGQLIYTNRVFSGNWMMKDNTIHVTVNKEPFFPHVVFPETNGLKIIVLGSK